MRQQTKPFTVEIKQSRKLKANDRKPSIWGGWTSRPMSTRSRRERRKSCRPLRVTMTDLDVSYAAALSSA